MTNYGISPSLWTDHLNKNDDHQMLPGSLTPGQDKSVHDGAAHVSKILPEKIVALALYIVGAFRMMYTESLLLMLPIQ